MNFLDLLIAIPLGYLIVKGYRRGIIFEVASLAGILLGSVLAVRFAHLLASLIGAEGDNILLVSFFVIFVGVIFLSLALGKLVERFVKLVHVGWFNNLAGALLGLIKGLCIVGVLLYYVAVVDIHEKVLTRNTKQSSLLYQPVERVGHHLAGRISSYVADRKLLHEEQEIGD